MGRGRTGGTTSSRRLLSPSRSPATSVSSTSELPLISSSSSVHFSASSSISSSTGSEPELWVSSSSDRGDDWGAGALESASHQRSSPSSPSKHPFKRAAHSLSATSLAYWPSAGGTPASFATAHSDKSAATHGLSACSSSGATTSISFLHIVARSWVSMGSSVRSIWRRGIGYPSLEGTYELALEACAPACLVGVVHAS
ncbi:hypothetical protein DENSPDRAFT_615258 [Dentipellis sp. KUC8613]|nr:hypothetical protein DENSPDRAFT_615258 [Dentipellis sp. KUC8613]